MLTFNFYLLIFNFYLMSALVAELAEAERLNDKMLLLLLAGLSLVKVFHFGSLSLSALLSREMGPS